MLLRTTFPFLILSFFVSLGTLLLPSQHVECANILAVFPHNGLSHWMFFRPIVSELVRSGRHNVTLLSYFGIEDDELQGRDNYNEFLFTQQSVLTNSFDMEHFTPSCNFLQSVRLLSAWGNSACDLLLNNEKTDEILERDDRFDLLITELFHTDCAVGLAYRLGDIPVVGLSSGFLMPYYFHRFGLPDSPSFIPSTHVGLSEKMSFMERLENFVVTKSVNFLFDFYQSQPDNEMLRKKFGSDFPDIRQLVQETLSLALVNDHFSFIGSRPIPPHVLQLAGLHLQDGKEETELNGDIQSLLDKSTNGVLLMSFGSIVRLSSLPMEKRDILMDVFRQLPYTVLMKWENTSLEVKDKPENIHFLPWLPQRQILKHPNVKVFFSHGGVGGIVEALVNKVPIVGTPIYGDQFHNVALISSRKAGVVVRYVDWSPESLMEAVNTCFSQEYQDNAALISYHLSLRNPLEMGIQAIEEVIATKGFELGKPYSVQLSWFIYYSLDVITFLLAIPTLLLLFCSWSFIAKRKCQTREVPNKPKTD